MSAASKEASKERDRLGRQLNQMIDAWLGDRAWAVSNEQRHVWKAQLQQADDPDALVVSITEELRYLRNRHGPNRPDPTTTPLLGAVQ